MIKPGTQVRILPPFGDGETLHEITAVQGVSADGEIVTEDAVAYQYEVNGAFYAQEFVEA